MLTKAILSVFPRWLEDGHRCHEQRVDSANVEKLAGTRVVIYGMARSLRSTNMPTPYGVGML